jgi:hypothetical protein
MILVLALMAGTGMLKFVKDRQVKNFEDDKFIKTRYKVLIFIFFIIAMRAGERVYPNIPFLNIFLSGVVAYEFWLAGKYFKQITGMPFMKMVKEGLNKINGFDSEKDTKSKKK